MESINVEYTINKKIHKETVYYETRITDDSRKIKEVIRMNNLDLPKIGKLNQEQHKQLSVLLYTLNNEENDCEYDYDPGHCKKYEYECKTCKYHYSDYFYNEYYFFNALNMRYLCCIECKLLGPKENYQKTVANLIAELLKFPQNIMFQILTYLPNNFYNETKMHLKYCCSCKKMIAHKQLK
jgi:hypothetical protein